MTLSHLPATGPTLRDRARTSVEPVARAFGRLGLSPNALTLIGFGIALGAAYLAAAQAWLLAGLMVAFGAAFDLLDGALARATNTTSRLGAFMDSVFDRAGEAVVYVGLAIGLSDGLVFGPPLAAAALASSFMVSYVRAKSESLGFTAGSAMARVGLAPREVRVAVLAVGLVVAGLLGGTPEGVVRTVPPWWIVIAGSLALITTLATITAIQRIVHVYLQAKKEQ